MPSRLLVVHPCSEDTAEGERTNKLDSILLNGNNIALMIPGGMPVDGDDGAGAGAGAGGGAAGAEAPATSDAAADAE